MFSVIAGLYALVPISFLFVWHKIVPRDEDDDTDITVRIANPVAVEESVQNIEGLPDQ